MELNKLEIATRLREFGEEHFETIKDFANALEMKPASLQSAYLNGRSIPGPELLLKLHNMKCDIFWLLTGKAVLYTKDGFNKLVKESQDYFAGLSELEKAKREIVRLKKENAELKKEREKVLKMFNK